MEKSILTSTYPSVIPICLDLRIHKEVDKINDIALIVVLMWPLLPEYSKRSCFVVTQIYTCAFVSNLELCSTCIKGTSHAKTLCFLAKLLLKISNIRSGQLTPKIP